MSLFFYFLDLPLECAVVAQESHKDGTPHLHVGLWLKEKLVVCRQNYFDSVGGKHGSYETMRSTKGTYEYLTKDDASPLIIGQLSTVLSQPAQSKSKTVAQMVLSGSTMKEVMLSDPGFFLLHNQKIQQYAAFVTEMRHQESLRSLVLPLVYLGEDLTTAAIVDWLNGNLLQDRPFKSRQLYLSGPPNYLKTSMIRRLEEGLRVLWAPMAEDNFDSYTEDADLIVFDEFKGQRTIEFFNTFLQGGTVILKARYRSLEKKKNMPVIILSNHTLEEAYHKVAAINPLKLDPLRARLLEIQLGAPIDLDNIKFNFSLPSSSLPSTPSNFEMSQIL